MVAECDANLSLPERLRLEIERAARAQGRSVNDLLAEAVDGYLKEKQWSALKSYGLQKARRALPKKTSTRQLLNRVA